MLITKVYKEWVIYMQNTHPARTDAAQLQPVVAAHLKCAAHQACSTPFFSKARESHLPPFWQ